MNWENIVKRGKSYSQRKKNTKHNEPIQKLMDELEREYEDTHSSLISMTSIRTQESIGYDKQMENIRQLQSVLSKIKKEIKEQQSQLKELDADKRKN